MIKTIHRIQPLIKATVAAIILHSKIIAVLPGRWIVRRLARPANEDLKEIRAVRDSRAMSAHRAQREPRDIQGPRGIKATPAVQAPQTRVILRGGRGYRVRKGKFRAGRTAGRHGSYGRHRLNQRRRTAGPHRPRRANRSHRTGFCFDRIFCVKLQCQLVRGTDYQLVNCFSVLWQCGV